MTSRALELWRPAAPVQAASWGELATAVLERGEVGAWAEAYRRLVTHPNAGRSIGIGWTAWHRARRADPGEAAREGVHEGAGMPKRCFPAALEYVLDHADIPSVRLVHGLVHEPPELRLPFMHAWVELGRNGLWDPTSSTFFDADSYRQVLQAIPVITYTPAQAAAHLLTEQSPGPWELGPIVTGLVDEWTARLLQRSPGLLEWVEGMAAADPDFAAAWNRMAGLHPFGLSRMHVLDHLERTGSWRDHPVGQPWRHGLHPLGELW